MHLEKLGCATSFSISSNLETFSVEETPSLVETLQKNYQQIQEMTQLTAQPTPTYQTTLLYAMSLERNQLKLSLMHPVVQYIPSGLDFKTLDLSINVANIPLYDKINFNRKVGEMLYSYLGQSSLTVSKATDLLEKVSNQLRKEKTNYGAQHIQNEEYKKLIIKLGVYLEEMEVIKTLLQNTKFEMQPLRNKLKIFGTEHAQTTKLTQVEK